VIVAGPPLPKAMADRWGRAKGERQKEKVKSKKSERIVDPGRASRDPGEKVQRILQIECK